MDNLMRPVCICSQFSDGEPDCPACHPDRQTEKAEPSQRGSCFPGTAGMHASQHRLAVTEEWMRGWNACLDEIDRLGGFNRENE